MRIGVGNRAALSQDDASNRILVYIEENLGFIECYRLILSGLIKRTSWTLVSSNRVSDCSSSTICVLGVCIHETMIPDPQISKPVAEIR